MPVSVEHVPVRMEAGLRGRAPVRSASPVHGVMLRQLLFVPGACSACGWGTDAFHGQAPCKGATVAPAV